MGGEVSRFSASMIKLIWSSTQILQLLLKPCPQVDAMYWFRFLLLLLSATKSPFLLMTNQNQTSPAQPLISRTNLLTQALYKWETDSEVRTFWNWNSGNNRVRCSPDWSVYRCIERYCMTPRQREDDNNLSVGHRNHLKLGIEPESWLQSHELGF